MFATSVAVLTVTGWKSSWNNVNNAFDFNTKWNKNIWNFDCKEFFLFGVTYTHESLKIKQRTCISTCHDDFNKLLLPCTFLSCGVMVMTHGFSIQVLYHNNLNLYQTVNDIDFQQSNVACVLCGVIVMFLFLKSGTAVQCYGNDTGF